jgi:hypothetical protein
VICALITSMTHNTGRLCLDSYCKHSVGNFHIVMRSSHASMGESAFKRFSTIHVNELMSKHASFDSTRPDQSLIITTRVPFNHPDTVTQSVATLYPSPFHSPLKLPSLVKVILHCGSIFLAFRECERLLKSAEQRADLLS